MMRPQDQASSFPGEKLADCLDFLRCGFLLSDHMIQTEYHQRVRIFEHTLIDGKFLPCLIDPLVNRRGVSCNLSHQRLEAQEGEVKQLQRSRNPLQEHLC